VSSANSFEGETQLVSKKDLPLHCPPKDSSKWSMHPKVFLSFDDYGKVRCPYCGAKYKLDS
jgi:uncharacterized Zn-finger protein